MEKRRRGKGEEREKGGKKEREEKGEVGEGGGKGVCNNSDSTLPHAVLQS